MYSDMLFALAPTDHEHLIEQDQHRHSDQVSAAQELEQVGTLKP